MDGIDEAERGYEEALAAIEAGDLIKARTVTTAAIRLARSYSRSKVIGIIPRLEGILRRIDELERQSEPLVIGDPLAALIRSCETFCVAGCCGRNAFDPGAATRWVQESAPSTATEVLVQLESLLAHLASREAKDEVRVLWSEIFEEALTADEWRSFMSTWRPFLEGNTENGQ